MALDSPTPPNAPIESRSFCNRSTNSRPGWSPTTPAVPSFHQMDSGSAFPMDTRGGRIVLDGGTNPQFASSGHLLYFLGGSLVSVPFDPRRLEVVGPSAAVLDGVRVTDEGQGQFTVADNGLVAYVRANPDTNRYRIVWVDRQGKPEPLSEDGRVFGAYPKLSPEVHRIVL